MKKTNIERIIKQGSTKQKIKLFFTDIAYSNTVGYKTAELIEDGDNLTVKSRDYILTDRDKNIIFQSIKKPKDKEYYEYLRLGNKAFLMFKTTITNYTKDFDYWTVVLQGYTGVILLHKSYQLMINEIMETFDGLTLEDEKLRERLIKKTLETLKPFGATKGKPSGYLHSINIGLANEDGYKLSKLIEEINEKIIDAKEFIKGIETFLSKQLPLQPYKKFVKDEEDKIKTNIQKCIKYIESLKMPSEKLQDNERYKILNWDEVEVEVTDEDIEDIKRAGL